LEETLRDIRRAYGDSLRQIEDLRKIGGASMAPLANQIQYYLTSMLDSAQSQGPLPVQYKNLTQVFKNQINSTLAKAFPTGDSVKRLSSYFEQTAGFYIWENALAHTERLTTIANSFAPTQVDFRLENDGIVIKLNPSDQANISACRVEAYKFTQELFKQKSILSYTICEKSELSVELRIRYSVLEDRDISFNVDSLCLNPIFSNYVTTIDALKNIGEHHVVMIDQNANVKLLNSIPDQDTLNSTMIHLPFLFRPLSLIIFGEGSLQAKHAKNSRVELFELFR